jgi:hypothetical protein
MSGNGAPSEALGAGFGGLSLVEKPTVALGAGFGGLSLVVKPTVALGAGFGGLSLSRKANHCEPIKRGREMSQRRIAK